MYEYKKLKNPSEDELNNLGEKGYEIVGTYARDVKVSEGCATTSATYREKQIVLMCRSEDVPVRKDLTDYSTDELMDEIRKRTGGDE